jgi:hypothetical protein
MEDFEVIEDLGLSLKPPGKGAAENQLLFEGAPEAFHGGVIVAVALAAHGGNPAGLAERAAVSCG